MDSNGVVTSASGAIKELAKVINACVLDEKNRAGIMSHLAESQKYLDNAVSYMGSSIAKSVVTIESGKDGLDPEPLSNEEKAKLSIVEAQDYGSVLMEKSSIVCSLYDAIHEKMNSDFQIEFILEDTEDSRRKFASIEEIDGIRTFLQKQLVNKEKLQVLSEVGMSDSMVADIKTLIRICDRLTGVKDQIRSFFRTTSASKEPASRKTSVLCGPFFHSALPKALGTLRKHVEMDNPAIYCAGKITALFDDYTSAIDSIVRHTLDCDRKEIRHFSVEDKTDPEYPFLGRLEFSPIRYEGELGKIDWLSFSLSPIKGEEDIWDLISALQHLPEIGTTVSYQNIDSIHGLLKFSSTLKEVFAKARECAEKKTPYVISEDTLLSLFVEFPSVPQMIFGTEKGSSFQDSIKWFNKQLKFYRETVAAISLNKLIGEESTLIDKLVHLCSGIETFSIIGKILLGDYKDKPNALDLLSSLNADLEIGLSLDDKETQKVLTIDSGFTLSPFVFISGCVGQFIKSHVELFSQQLNNETAWQTVKEMSYMFRQKLPDMGRLLCHFNSRFLSTVKVIEEYNSFLDGLKDENTTENNGETTEASISEASAEN